MPVLPASAGAVPSTAIFPLTADCQVVLSASLPDVPVVGVSDEHVVPELGSPITRAEYAANWDAVIPRHVVGVTCVTVKPAACAIAVSGAVVSPFCSSTSTDSVDALAEAEATAAATAETPTAAATVNATGTRDVAAAVTGASKSAVARRK